MRQPDLVLLHAPSVFDFRRESILYGPISDVVPSMPIFEMYPVGFTSMASYLEKNNYQVRIINLAHRMLQSDRYDPAATIAKLRPRAFGIDLHWLPHAQGALAVAQLCKKLHPDIPVLLGGFSSTYYHEELIERPEVDLVLRGDSTEDPLLQLMRALEKGLPLHDIPNLTWKDDAGAHVNPLSYVPKDLGAFAIDYGYVMHSVVRYRDLMGVIPFLGWMDYPITTALTCKGCLNTCNTCGGSAFTSRRFYGRERAAFRDPKDLARDVHRIAEFSHGPVFILGDLRQAGDEYADAFFQALGKAQSRLMVELFEPAPRSFYEKLARVAPDFTVEISMESHDDNVRRAFGRHYTAEAAEASIADALDLGCARFDVFFMIGLPEQTFESVLGTVDYCEHLLERFSRGGTPRVLPFLSPLAPFLDPGSPAFEDPERYGYRLFHRTVEEHRQALLSPSWKYVLNYETRWMSRDEIVESTYEAGLRLNRVKQRYGLLDAPTADAVEERILRARRLMQQIDDVMSIPDERRRQLLLAALKPQVDTANVSTVCDKRELNLPMGLLKIHWPGAVRTVLSRMSAEIRRAVT
ncbi:MAG: TIGR04190 family B12-binding domain/radical SAM domain protein [Anaerolineae bacterium]|nr:TIGR04190 family B12-binding domain/radical SAM domain protein [Anaerolineae bacterium]